MRTTVDLDEHLLRRVKARAAERGVTLSEIVSDALTTALSRTPSDGEWKLMRLSGAKLRPGIDLDDNAALRDLMDE